MRFFRNEHRVSLAQIQSDFAMAGAYVGVSLDTQDSNSYWLHIDLGNSYEWRLYLQKLQFHPINALTYSQIWQNGAKLLDTSDTGSVWEYAYNSPATGDQIGNGHGSDTQSSLNFYLDDVLVTPTTTMQTGTELRVVRVSSLDDTGDPAAEIGTATTTYTLSISTGMTIDVEFDWISEPSPVTGGYVSMWPFVESFDRAYLHGMDAAFDLSTATVDSLGTPTIDTAAVVCWQSSGEWGLCQLHDSAITTWVQDRVSPGVGKIYPSETPNLDAGFVQTCLSANYRVARFGGYDLPLLPTG